MPAGGKPEDSTNHRNGTSGKTVLTDDGPLALDIPRDRAGTFEPRLIGKHERRFTGFDDKVIALSARGLTVREIQAFLGEMYGVDVSPDLISRVTDGVVAEVTAWQARPLEPMYPGIPLSRLAGLDAKHKPTRYGMTRSWKSHNDFHIPTADHRRFA